MIPPSSHCSIPTLAEKKSFYIYRAGPKKTHSKLIPLSPSAADASGVHASVIVVDDDGGTLSPVGWLASMPVEDAPGGSGMKAVVES